jgi:hypothetical protein
LPKNNEVNKEGRMTHSKKLTNAASDWFTLGFILSFISRRRHRRLRLQTISFQSNGYFNSV